MAIIRSPNTVCCVFDCSCKLSFLEKNSLQFFKFPKRFTDVPEEKDLLHKWIQAVKLPGKITNDMVVCSRHFSQEDFVLTDDKIPKLKIGAVPSEHLPLVWRNKFFTRDYGRLIKLLEFRGIGRLRLCHEAKIGKRLRKRKQTQAKKMPEPFEVPENPPKVSQNQSSSLIYRKETNISSDVLKVSSTFSLSSDGNDDSFSSQRHDNEDNSLTSEIMIKEEPLFEEPDVNDMEREETVEEMLARMNEDSNEPNMNSERNINMMSMDFDEHIESEGSICNVCGEEDCEGNHEVAVDRFSCDLCGKAFFKSARQLTAHKLCHTDFRRNGKREDKLKIVNQSGGDLDKTHVCMLCDESFKSKASLIQHVNSHTIINDYRCKMCKQYFETLEDLDLHVRKHKVIKKEYSCRECGQKFRSKAACWVHLNGHMRSRRPGLACDVCGRVLSTRATLKEHMFIHSGEKPFECQLCGRKIRHRANFIIHVQGHSLGQPHVCQTCGMGFAKRNELNSHIAAEHPEDRPFHCIICGMRFRTESRFHKHAFSHDAYLEE